MKTAVWRRGLHSVKVRPWLLEKRLHCRMYKLEEKAPVTMDIDWIKRAFMKLYGMTTEEVQGLIQDLG